MQGTNKPVSWLVWFSGAMFYCYQFILRTCTGVMTDDIMRDFSIDAFSVGILSAFYYNSYAAMQIPVGILADRFGPRVLLPLAISICSFGSLVFSYADSMFYASFGRMMMGLGSAFGYVGTLKLASLSFSSERMGMAVGFTMVLGTIGATLGGAPYAYLISKVGWRNSLVVMSALGLILFIFALSTLRSYSHADNYSGLSIVKSLRKTVSSAQMWLISLYASLMYVPLSSLADLWGVSFFTYKLSVSKEISSSLTSMIYIGVAVGSPIVTYLSDILKNRLMFMRFGALIGVFLYAAIIYIPYMPMPMIYFLLFLAGFSFAGQILSFVLLAQKAGTANTGISIGFMNMIVMLSGVIFEPLIGKLLRHGNDSVSLCAYTCEDFYRALIIIPLSLIGAFFISFAIDDKSTSP